MSDAGPRLTDEHDANSAGPGTLNEVDGGTGLVGELRELVDDDDGSAVSGLTRERPVEKVLEEEGPDLGRLVAVLGSPDRYVGGAPVLVFVLRRSSACVTPSGRSLARSLRMFGTGRAPGTPRGSARRPRRPGRGRVAPGRRSAVRGGHRRSRRTGSRCRRGSPRRSRPPLWRGCQALAEHIALRPDEAQLLEAESFTQDGQRLLLVQPRGEVRRLTAEHLAGGYPRHWPDERWIVRNRHGSISPCSGRRRTSRRG
jgi:hypothetical protein